MTRTANGITTLFIGGIFEQDVPSGVTRSQYLFAGRVIAQRASVGAVPLVYLHGDHLGSVSAVTNGTTGVVVERQEYGPWGAIRSGGITGTTVNYTGQRRDGTGLLYYGARYYDPMPGKFLSPDSGGVRAGTPQSLNRYAYVGNNPLNHTDPTGHCRPDECDYEQGGDNYRGGNDNGNGGGGDNGDNGGHDNSGNDSGGGAAEAQATAYHALAAPPGTGTGTGAGIGTGNKVADAILALVLGSALLSNLTGGGPLPGPSGSGQGLPPDLATTTSQNRTPNIVYRGLAPGEDPLQGLVADAPFSSTTRDDKIINNSPSSYISTTRDFAEAQRIADACGTQVITIDLDKIPGTYYDVSNVIGAFTYLVETDAIQLALSQREVLVQGGIPPGAIIG